MLTKAPSPSESYTPTAKREPRPNEISAILDVAKISPEGVRKMSKQTQQISQDGFYAAPEIESGDFKFHNNLRTNTSKSLQNLSSYPYKLCTTQNPGELHCQQLFNPWGGRKAFLGWLMFRKAQSR